MPNTLTASQKTQVLGMLDTEDPLVLSLSGKVLKDDSVLADSLDKTTLSAWLDSMGYGIPIGAIFPFAAAPDTSTKRWVLCNGDRIPINDYPELFDVIGSTFGTATATEFYVPDLTDRFIRGTGTAALGVKQDASVVLPTITVNVPEHTHALTDGGVTVAGGTPIVSIASTSTGIEAAHWNDYDTYPSNPTHWTHKLHYTGNTTGAAPSVSSYTKQVLSPKAAFDATVTFTNGTETRPKNMSLAYYIKAK